MGITSTHEYWAHIDASAMGADEPVDASRAATTVNNLQHGYDTHFQHRVNWTSMGAADRIDGDPLTYVQYFPLTITRDGLPPNLDIRAAIYNNAGGNTIIVNGWIVPYGAFVADDGKASESEAIDSFTVGSITTTTPGWTVDRTVFFDQGTGVEKNAVRNKVLQARYKPLLIEENSQAHESRVSLWKLVLEATVGPSSGEAVLGGLMIREFG